MSDERLGRRGVVDAAAGRLLAQSDPGPITDLVRDLCRFATGVVVPDNAPLFRRVAEELPLRLHAYPSGSSFNGWSVPDMWHVERATVSRDGQTVFDGTRHPLGVAAYARSFAGRVELDELKAHVATSARLPDAYVYHCMWQYRPWDAGWALSIPHRVLQTMERGVYDIDIRTVRTPGEMLVGELEHRGRSERTIVFNAHTCHPGMANDDMAGVAVLIRLFQWLSELDTYYTYRLILAPEHIGTVFYLRDRPDDLARIVGGVFAEMAGSGGPVKIASSFLGNQPIDRAVRHAALSVGAAHVTVPWRRGAGNDETVWEAPGYEVPFVEVSRSLDLYEPYPEYHTSLDTADLMDESLLAEFFRVLQQTVVILEANARLHRTFDGLICLSNPEYDLYVERPDPSVDKQLSVDADQWGYLLDCVLRYLDGSMTVLDVAERHGLPFNAVHAFLARFRDKGLVLLGREPIERVPISAKAATAP